MNKQQLTDALTEGIREGKITESEREEALRLYSLIYEDGFADEDSPSHVRLCAIINTALNQSREDLLIKAGVEIGRITEEDAELYYNPNTPEQAKKQIIAKPSRDSSWLWKSIILHEQQPFKTARGIHFSYTVSRNPSLSGRHYKGESVDGYGNELWISTEEGVKKKSISRSTVELAYKRMMSGEIKGPRSLGVPGAGSYLYPVLKKIMTTSVNG